VLELQAIKNEHTDHEEALWPDRFPLSSLCEKRDVMVGSGRKRDWESQYQQNPKPYSGVYCKPEYYEERWIDESLPSEMNIYMASDFAVSEVEENSDPDWTEHGVFGVGPDEKTYVLDWWSGQATADVWIDGLLDLASKWKPLLWVGEGGVIRRSIEPFLTKRMRERGIFLNSEWRQSTQRKEVRARSFQARSAMKLIVFPRHCVWSERVIDQCIAFPGGKHDDAFDVLSLFCSAIDETNSPVLKPVSEYNKNDRWKPITAKFYGNENKWKTI
jgi:predicted phage terminase large subunit-like protein